MSKTSILRSIKAGRISAGRDEFGQWAIEPCELHRVYPPLADDTGTENGTGERAVTGGETAVPSQCTRRELKRLSGLGVRGIRFNLVQAGATTVEMLEPLSKRVNDLGWHVQLNLRPDLLVQLEDLLLRSPSPLVFNHLAHIPRDNGVEHRAFKTERAFGNAKAHGTD